MAPLNIMITILISILMASGVTSQLVMRLNHTYANIETSKRSGMLEKFKHHDIMRHMRILNSIVDLPVGGSPDIETIGLYFTKILLGTPPKQYHVQIDTGSAILWVTCKPCDDCPKKSGIEIPLNIFDPRGSSTFSPLPCNDTQCVADYHCTSPGQYCGYSHAYASGSGISGYFVSDEFIFEQISEQYSTNNISTKIIFGCGFHPSGGFTKPQQALDGIFGLGKNRLSFLYQLFSNKLAPNIFSHCLGGPDLGGGMLVLGEITEPGMVYTRLLQSTEHYLLNLLGIAVNGMNLSIDPQIFATTDHSGTIVDSGTALAYITEEAYDPFINSILAVVLNSAELVMVKGNPCFLMDNSVDEIFPLVTLYFEDAVMKLIPQDYLVVLTLNGTTQVRCMGWQKSPNNLRKWTILGDLVLKNKIMVYNLEKQTLGWTSYDCFSGVSLSFFYDNNYGMLNGSGITPSSGRSPSNGRPLSSGRSPTNGRPPSSGGCPPSKIVKGLVIYIVFLHVILHITIIPGIK